MAGSWTTKSIKDAGGTSISMRVWDESGAGAGPFSFGQVITDGTPGGSVALATLNTASFTYATSGGSAGVQGVALPTDQPVANKVLAQSNGMTSSRVVAAASTNATSLKASNGALGEIDVFNVAAYDVFLKLYNKAAVPILALATPVNAAFSQTDAGGSLVPSTTYWYRVSATNANGETLASTETSQATSAVAGNTHTVVVNWGAVTGATGYKVYGRTTGAELLIASVGAVTTYTDTGAITPAGALPAANTTFDTPTWTIPIKAGTGYSRHFPRGKWFATGVAYAITKLQADSDTTVLVANDLTGTIDWI